MAETIREIIRKKSEELRYPDQLGAHGAAEALVELTSLLASLNAYIGEKLYWYNVKKMECLKEQGSAAKAKIVSESTNEWREWNEAELQRKATEEMIRSIKYFLRVSESEIRLQ